MTPDYSDFTNHGRGRHAYNDIICCTASHRALGSKVEDPTYIQGAGDDSETWAHGLTPDVFWAHAERLLESQEHDLPMLIRQCIFEERGCITTANSIVQVGITSLYIGPTAAITPNRRTPCFDGVIVCEEKWPSQYPPSSLDVTASAVAQSKILHLQCSAGKKGSRALRLELHKALPFIQELGQSSNPPRFLITCPTGKDLCVGVTLAILCMFYDSQCRIHPQTL